MPIGRRPSRCLLDRGSIKRRSLSKRNDQRPCRTCSKMSAAGSAGGVPKNIHLNMTWAMEPKSCAEDSLAVTGQNGRVRASHRRINRRVNRDQLSRILRTSLSGSSIIRQLLSKTILRPRRARTAPTSYPPSADYPSGVDLNVGDSIVRARIAGTRQTFGRRTARGIHDSSCVRLPGSFDAGTESGSIYPAATSPAACSKASREPLKVPPSWTNPGLRFAWSLLVAFHQIKHRSSATSSWESIGAVKHDAALAVENRAVVYK